MPATYLVCVVCVLIGVDRLESCLSALLYQLTPSAKATPTHIDRHRFFPWPCLVFCCRLHRRCGYCSPSVPTLALAHLSSPVPPCTRKRFSGSHAGTKRSRDEFFEPACPSVYATRWIRQAHAMARMGVRVSPDADCRKTLFLAEARGVSLSDFAGSKPHTLSRPVVRHYTYRTRP